MQIFQFKNWIAFLIGCVVSFGIAEVVLRIYAPVELRLRGQKINLKVNRASVYENTTNSKLPRHILHVKNEIGFRGENPPPDFSDRLTLVAVGGSTTESYYISEGKTWVDQLGFRLKGTFDKVWINNAGLDGHSTFGHLILLKDYIVPLRPKVVLFLVGVNDQENDKINMNDINLLKELDDPKLSLEENGVSAFLMDWVNTAAHYSDVVALALNLGRYREAMMQTFTGPMGHLRATDLSQTNPPISQAEQQELESGQHKFMTKYRTRLERLLRLSQKQGIEPILITQTVFGGGLREAKLELYNDVVRQVGRDHGVFIIDLAQSFSNQEVHYYDHIHYTEEGSSEVAKVLHQKLCPYLTQKYPNFVQAGKSCESASVDLETEMEATHDQILKAYDQAIAANPENPKPHYERGFVYFAYFLEMELAIADFTRSIEKPSPSPLAYYYRGMAQIRLNRYDQAIQDLTQFVNFEEDIADFYIKTAYTARAYAYIKTSRPHEAIEDYTQVLRISQNEPIIYQRRGHEYFKLDKYAEAAADFTQALKYDPETNRKKLLHARGMALFQMKEWVPAFNDFEQVLLLDPNHADSYRARGMILLFGGQTELGCADLKRGCYENICEGTDIIRAWNDYHCDQFQ